MFIHFYATVFTVMLLVALSVAFRHATETHLEFEVANKDEEKKSWLFTERGLGFQTAGSGTNSGLSGLESSALTTRPRRPGANLRRNATSHVLFLNQSVLADFDDRKKIVSHFKTRSLSGTSNKTGTASVLMPQYDD